MGLFSKLFNNKSTVVKGRGYNSFDDEYDVYSKWLDSSPKFEDFFPKEDEQLIKRYSDKYKTDEGYKLREIFLLVWWGRIKKGRQLNVAKPKYFIYDYNINVDKVTNKFISDKILVVNEDNIVKLTEAGHDIYNKYLELWNMHRNGANLDSEFIGWNEIDYIVKQNNQKIKSIKKQILYLEAGINHNKSFPLPKTSRFFTDYTESINNDTQYVEEMKKEIIRLTEQNESLM